MTASLLFVACGVERHAIAIEPVTARYEIRSHECPKCKTVVRLVKARGTTTGKRKPAKTRGTRTLKPKDWSEEEISQFIEMIGQRIKLGEIARALGRHVGSARTKARALGLIIDIRAQLYRTVGLRRTRRGGSQPQRRFLLTGGRNTDGRVLHRRPGRFGLERFSAR